jgi:hypothetical protein
MVRLCGLIVKARNLRFFLSLSARTPAQEVSVEQLAKVIHHYHNALAPDFDEVRDRAPSCGRRFHPMSAKSGEADWGCRGLEYCGCELIGVA